MIRDELRENDFHSNNLPALKKSIYHVVVSIATKFETTPLPSLTGKHVERKKIAQTIIAKKMCGLIAHSEGETVVVISRVTEYTNSSNYSKE